MRSVAENEDIPWEKVILTEGSKGPVLAYRKLIWCAFLRHDGNRNYIKPDPEIWLYLRKYEDDTIKYFVSNALDTLEHSELDRAATLRWPIEQCFSECKGYLGMSYYE